MSEGVLPNICTPTENLNVYYPQAVKASQDQFAILWPAEEIGVELDESDIRNKCTEGERHGITTVLKLFSKYEVCLGGEEFWGGKVSQMFPRPEIQRMASTFAFVELGIHGPFYRLINETLNLASEEFYTAWKDDPVLVERMAFIEGYANENDPLISTAAFAFMEGAVLFSNFAFLKSFGSGGRKLIPHIVAGIDASAKDENFHSIAASWLHRQCRHEMQEMGMISEQDIKQLEATVHKIGEKVYEHESRITDMIFEKGEITSVTKEDMLHFIRNRIDTVLSYLGYVPLFGDEEGVIAGWFYQHLSTYKSGDFFVQQVVQYVRTWDKTKLTFPIHIMGEFEGIVGDQGNVRTI